MAGESRAFDVVHEDDVREALCVLAGSDPHNCSYSRGYVKRQAVFACSTCTPAASPPAGMCLACANKCHDGHDIYELYTKRNFRCDCGNSKFGAFRCQLLPAKDAANDKNLYNHNFSGCYCTCERPYPDTDDQVNDEMIQCVICEDWFHTRHLGCSVAESDELQEMVCESCMNKAPFLWTYAAHLAVPPEEETQQEEEEEDSSGLKAEESPTSMEPLKCEVAAGDGSPCRRTQEGTCDSPGRVPPQSAACKLAELQARTPERPQQGAVFWPYAWRSQLCTCTGCKRAYVAAQVQFLMDPSDSLLAYEIGGMTEPFCQNLLMTATSTMSRVQQLEFIYGYNELMTSINEFLHHCAAEGKVVTVDAVHQFFEELRATKRQRPNTGNQ